MALDGLNSQAATKGSQPALCVYHLESDVAPGQAALAYVQGLQTNHHSRACPVTDS
jgi:hypothetical protein